ncbi:DUF4347 domain-containing protein [Heliobacterium chlorum]|uniref:DUF4347 domain-containing protein n=1 Tax=Heliobacterium chlorum TaxID=2698 RepID=A0ABR7T0E8_HELCL|nr:DUF4347 domain-containing protein [Heliobacterium chlorum]MBC9783577.1 DUF4347 domain-containing protein [Heliobacterium chlorum]
MSQSLKSEGMNRLLVWPAMQKRLALVFLVLCLLSLYVVTGEAHAKHGEIAFIDRAITHPLLVEQSLPPGVEAVFLESERDGIEQIADTLRDRHDVRAIHIISHGAPGKVFLGKGSLSAANLSTYREQLASIGAALGKDGDILIYGCDVARGEAGKAFISQVADATSAHIAASDDATGAKALHGNWNLEAKTGSIGVAGLAIEAYDSLLFSPIYSHTLDSQGNAGNLRVSSYDGTLQVERHNGSSFQNQYYDYGAYLYGSGISINHGGTVSGSETIYETNTYGNVQPLQVDSQIMNGSHTSITTTWSTTSGPALTIVQTVTLPSLTSQTIDMTWTITNNSGSTLTDIRFMRGVDTVLSGSDAGPGFYNAPSRTVGTNKVESGLSQMMGMQGITIPSKYYTGDKGALFDYMCAGEIPTFVDTTITDNGYGMEWDNASLGNGQSWTIQAKESFVQTTDLTPPNWAATYPKTGTITDVSVNVQAQTNKTGRAYYVVLSDNASTPTADQVRNGQNASGASAWKSGYADLTSTSSPATISLTGLTAATNYDVWLVAEDSTGILQASATKVDIATSGGGDTTPPNWAGGYPQAGTVTYNSAQVLVQTNEIGKAYYVVLPDGASQPSATQVKAGQNQGGVDVGAGNKGQIDVTANTPATISLTGLNPSTSYDVWVVTEDGVPNVQATAVKVDIATSAAPDTTPPNWAGGYPQAGTITDTSAQVLVQTNETGKAYYVVLPDGASQPSAAQVKAGQNQGGVDVGAGNKGQIDVTANTPATISLTGLNPSTSYDVWVVTEDGVPNVQATAVKVDIATSAAPDTTPPTWAGGYPQAGTITDTSAQVLVQTNEAGKAYYVVLPDGASEPSASQVKSGQNQGGVDVGAGNKGQIDLTANTPVTISLTGLNPSTSYDVWVVTEDGVPNVQATAVKVGIATSAAPDTTPPTWAGGYPQAGTITDTSAQVLVQTNEAGKAYYVVLPDGAAQPSAAQVKAGQNQGGVDVGAGNKGQIDVTANTLATISLTDLNPSTSYDVWVVTEDGVANLQGTAVKVDIATSAAPDTTPPNWAGGYPQVGTITDTSAQVLLQTNEAGKAYYVVLPDGAAQPSAAQVKAGQNQGGVDVGAGNKGQIDVTANTPATISITGLNTSTNYDVYVVAEDSVPNLQASATLVNIATGAAPDTTPPTWAGGYPQAGTITNNSADVLVETNETGKAYYVVVADGADAPTAAEVKLGQAAGGADPGAGMSGFVNLTSTSSPATISITGLNPSTNYDVYVVAEDGVPNLQATAVKVDIATSAAPDTTPPNWAATYPKEGTLTDNSANVLAKSNESGKAYYVVLPNGAPAPTAAQVKAGQDANGADAGAGKKGYVNLTANTEATISLIGLSASTDYDVYVVTEDGVPNLQTTPVKVDIATSAALGNNAPAITTQALPNGAVGAPYNTTLDASGGATPYTWSIANGALPIGLDLNTVTGAVYGTPTAAGTSNFTVRVTDHNAQTATSALSLQVNAQSLSSNNLISALVLSGITLNETISSAVYDYTATVPYNISSTTVTAAVDATAALRVNGIDVASGLPSDSIPLSVGPNTIYIIVTAQDGTKKTYTVTVTRQADRVTAAKRDLEILFQPGDAWNSVTGNVTLPASSTGSVPVTWSSSKPEIISANGTVQRPSYGSDDVTVTLTATLSLDGLSVQKAFLVIVKPQNPGAVQSTTQRTVDVKAGETGTTAAQVAVTRTVWSTPEGSSKIVDSVSFNEQKASESVQEAVYRQQSVVSIDLTDNIASQADVFNVGIDRDALARLNGYQKELQIASPDVKVKIPTESIQALTNDSIDLYFRVVPIKQVSVVDQLAGNAKNSSTVSQATGGSASQVQVVGRPMTIETNLNNRRTFVTFPLQNISLPTTASERDAYLASLKVWVQHTDGTEEVKTGTVQYNNLNQPVGITIEINKFSVFTIIRAQAIGRGNGGGGGTRATLPPEKTVEPVRPTTPSSETIKPYVLGYPDGTFKPEQAITRGELATIIARHLTGEPKSIAIEYSDVPSNHWAFESIARLQAMNLLQGYPDGSFKPDRFVTRGELATLVSKWKQLTSNGHSTFGDVQGHWAEKSIAAMEEANIIKGYPDGFFHPNQAVTRAEIVVLMNQIIGRKPLLGLSKSTWSDVPSKYWAAGDIEAASTTYTLEVTVVKK